MCLPTRQVSRYVHGIYRRRRPYELRPQKEAPAIIQISEYNEIPFVVMDDTLAQFWNIRNRTH